MPARSTSGSRRARGTSRRSARCRRANPFAWEASGALSHTFSDRFYAGVGPVLQQGARQPSQPGLLPRQCRLPAHRRGSSWRSMEPTRIRPNIAASRCSRRSPSAPPSGRPRAPNMTAATSAGASAYSTFHGQDVGQWDLSLDANSRRGRRRFQRGRQLHDGTGARRPHPFHHLGRELQPASPTSGPPPARPCRWPSPTAASRWRGRSSTASPSSSRTAARRAGTLVVNPIEDGHLAASDWLGPAVVPDLSAYSEREVFIEPSGMPVGYDIGPRRLSLSRRPIAPATGSSSAPITG